VLLRPPTEDDLPAVLAVLRARDTADLGSATEFDLARDAAVVELPRVGVVAYADVNRHGAAAAVVPDHEGGSAGSALLDWAERRQVERARDRHRQVIAAGNEQARALLSGAGYTPGRHYWRMVRAFDSPPEAAKPPPGFSIRTPDVDRDAATLHALDDASFSAVPDYVPASVTAFADDHLRAHDLDVGLSVVGECGGEIAGFLLTRRWEDEETGFVDLLAVHPAHQHRGLGSALLTAAFLRIASAGLKQAELTVASDNPRALGLYERAGMTVRFRQDVWERAISRESDRPSG